MSRTIAIVGSGPGGMYAAQGLIDKDPACRVDVIERLPAPFGLIRAGVAPDHQKTKRVSKAFERTLIHDRVRYLGNVEVGRDIAISELIEIYDAVVLAYGAPHDNRLGIVGEELPNVHGSNAFVGWYNGHPDFKNLEPDLNIEAAAIIGVGNVALDVARVLAKTRSEMAVTDLADYAAVAAHSSPVTDIYMLGRRGPVEAAFTNVELREMGELANALPIVNPDHLPERVTAEYMSDRDLRLRQKNVETIRSFLDVNKENRAKRVHFGFFLSPLEIIGKEAVEGVRCKRTTVDENGKVHGMGDTVDIPCQLVITCIGSRAYPIGDLPFNDDWGIVEHDKGKVADRLYAVGWLKRGATGTIGTNKNDSLEVVEKIISEYSAEPRDGCADIDAKLKEKSTRVVSYADWQTIDQHEVTSAPEGAPRRKLITPKEMIDVLDKDKF